MKPTSGSASATSPPWPATAASSVVRACQRLGFRGYQELKIAAARQSPTRAPAPDPHDDPAARALADTIHASREALDDLATTLTADRLLAAATALNAAPRIVVAAAGLSAAVAADTAYRLRALGCIVDAPADSLTAQLEAAQLPPGAVCLASSELVNVAAGGPLASPVAVGREVARLRGPMEQPVSARSILFGPS